MSEWVTGDDILGAAGVASPSESEEAWATVCASAVSAGFDHYLADAGVDDEYPPPEVVAQAQLSGLALYKRREAPFGVLEYADLQGEAIRLSADVLAGAFPVLRRYAGIGFA